MTGAADRYLLAAPRHTVVVRLVAFGGELILLDHLKRQKIQKQIDQAGGGGRGCPSGWAWLSGTQVRFRTQVS